MPRFHVGQKVRIIREPCSGYFCLIGRVGIITDIRPRSGTYELKVIGKHDPCADAFGYSEQWLKPFGNYDNEEEICSQETRM
jgi:hypothetical protein